MKFRNQVIATSIGLCVLITLSLTLTANVTPTLTKADSTYFSWRNASIYFVILDRFKDGDASNNNPYERGLDASGNLEENYVGGLGTFHGGDIKGLTQKVNEGYFKNLGTNVIWITSPFEQVHGWVNADGFKHYSYHGYNTLDFTSLDKNFGTKEDLKTFIDTAHKQGIRIMLDTVINHAGYVSMKDMDEYKYGSLKTNWKNYYYQTTENQMTIPAYQKQIDYSQNLLWNNWWGKDWVRNDEIIGYDKSDLRSEIRNCCMGLPDFKTESAKNIDIPEILKTKWLREGRYDEEMKALNQYFDTTGKKRTVQSYLIKWITDWVKEYGIDSFRVDTAVNVDMNTFKALKFEASNALVTWKNNNPTSKPENYLPTLESSDQEFYTMGEAYLYNVDLGKNFKNEEGKEYYKDNVFNSLLNFAYQYEAKEVVSISGLFKKYSDIINGDAEYQAVNYLSSHDLALYDRNKLMQGATNLFLCPGGISVFYGDETKRMPDPIPPYVKDSTLETRSNMNWDTMDQKNLDHWQKLGSFRSKHISIGAGEHIRITEPKTNTDPYIFGRVYSKNGILDRIVAAINVKGTVTMEVNKIFSNGAILHDFYSNREAVVSNGKVTFEAGENGVLLLEERNPHNVPGFIIHFKKPSTWSDPEIYFYRDDFTPAWGNASKMLLENGDWYSYSVEGFSDINIIFKDSKGNQFPAPMNGGYLRSSESWFDGQNWK